MNRKYDAVLFDLDGTVSESHRGIIASAKQALENYHWPMPADFDFRKFIGPPICQSLMEFAGMSEQQAEIVMKEYRRIYNAGEIYNCCLYDGIAELFASLRAQGVAVCLATSKPQPLAERVAEHLGIASQLSVLAGADLSDKSSDKSILIERCLLETGTPKERALMVGDTRFDAAGAKKVGVDFVGVLYGYGTKAEMAQLGAAAFVQTPAQLEAMILQK